MGRILAIDYGAKRTGLAVTDPQCIIASPLTTVATFKLMDYLKNYLQEEEVDRVVVGDPKQKDGSPTHATPLVEAFITTLKEQFPKLEVDTHDERYTSKMAQKSMLAAGTSKKNRQKKSNLDVISATLILQSYLEDLNLSSWFTP